MKEIIGWLTQFLKRVSFFFKDKKGIFSMVVNDDLHFVVVFCLWLWLMLPKSVGWKKI